MCSAEALNHWQLERVLNNPGLAFVPATEVALILLNHLADEMLSRAVILQGQPSKQVMHEHPLTVLLPDRHVE